MKYMADDRNIFDGGQKYLQMDIKKKLRATKFAKVNKRNLSDHFSK